MDNIKFMVCPHDTASDPDKWFHFAQCLTKHINSSVQFDQSMDFPDFHKNFSSSGLIYANPQDSLRLIKEHDYTPVARPSNLYDEIVFIANAEIENPKLTDLAGTHVVSVNTMMVTRVGVKYLFEKNIKPASIGSKNSWMGVAKSIFRGEEKYAFVYKDFYNGLNSLSKSGMQEIGETQDGTIHHNILIAPDLKHLADKVHHCLIDMHKQDAAVKRVLAELGVEHFVGVTKDDIFKFETLGKLGSELMVSD